MAHLTTAGSEAGRRTERSTRDRVIVLPELAPRFPALRPDDIRRERYHLVVVALGGLDVRAISERIELARAAETSVRLLVPVGPVSAAGSSLLHREHLLDDAPHDVRWVLAELLAERAVRGLRATGARVVADVVPGPTTRLIRGLADLDGVDEVLVTTPTGAWGRWYAARLARTIARRHDVRAEPLPVGQVRTSSGAGNAWSA